MENPLEESRQLDPKECEHAAPCWVDNGVLDIYLCKKFGGKCYFEPNGGKQFKKMCGGLKSTFSG